MPTFIRCTISQNITQGGVSGIGGARPVGFDRTEPVQSYEIPSFGGGVYCAKGSEEEGTNVVFKGCTITNNVAPKPDATFHLDPYLGHGGGVAFEETASVIFEKYELPDGREIRCTISDNEAAVGGGIYWADANPLLNNCDFANNAAYQGAAIFASHGLGLVNSCNIYGNFAGSQQGDFDDVPGQGGGIYALSIGVEISDCNIAYNEAGASGGGIYVTGTMTDPMNIKNCLLTYNQAGRDGAGISVNWYANPTISNCTLANNNAVGSFGDLQIGLGGGAYFSYHSESVVKDSIFWDNFAEQGPQIMVGSGFEFDPREATLTVEYSDIQGGQGAAQIDPGCTLNWLNGNISTDPLFVTGTFGDFYLSQTEAGQPQNSPCVDVGSDLAMTLGLGLFTTRSDDSFDSFDNSIVDMGYHYPLVNTLDQCRYCDLNTDGVGDPIPDGIIDLYDMAIFASYWLDEQCELTDWCDGVDFNSDGSVDFDDILIFAACWLEEDEVAPMPNPALWAQDGNPRWIEGTSYEITMTAVEASDNWSWGIEYFFECVTGNCHDSGWQEENIYTDTDIPFAEDCTYVIRVRDRRGNVTDPNSEPRSAIAGWETNPPSPVGWLVEPHSTSATTIAMTALTATDPDGHGPVEYRFLRKSPTTLNSGWQTGTSWTDNGLTEGQTYCYTVQVRDAWGNWVESDTEVCATATAPPENDPPTPNPAQLASFVRVNAGLGAYYDIVTAVVAADATGVEYYFEDYDTGNNSGWQVSEVWETPHFGGSTSGHRYQVTYRDTVPPPDTNYGNPSGWFQFNGP